MLIFSPSPGSAFPLCLLPSQAPHGRQTAAPGSRTQKSLKDLLRFSVLDRLPCPSSNHAQWLGDSKAEPGMVSPSLEVHRHRGGWGGLPLKILRVWLLEGWMNTEEQAQQMPTRVQPNRMDREVFHLCFLLYKYVNSTSSLFLKVCYNSVVNPFWAWCCF